MHKKRDLLIGTMITLVLATSACLPTGVFFPATETGPTDAPTEQAASPIAPDNAGPFRRISALDGLPGDANVLDLWIAPDGALWTVTNAGLYIRAATGEGGFRREFDQPLMQIVGMQEDGTVWALGAEGNSIHAFDGTGWEEYGLDEGWDPLPGGVKEGAIARDIQVWVATGGDDLRLYDPGSMSWDSLQATDIGFTPADPDYQGHYLTDVLAFDNEIWVADCIGMGEGFAGQGVRALVEHTWVALAETEGLCIFDLEMDAEGRVWVGGQDTILVYEPASGTWTQVPPPPWERFQFIVDIAFDPAGNLVVGALQCGGASCDTVHTYIRQDDIWQPILDDADYWYPGPKLDFDNQGTAWTCWQGAVYQQEGTATRLIGGLRSGSCELRVDGEGLIWIAAVNGEDTGLWQVQR